MELRVHHLGPVVRKTKPDQKSFYSLFGSPPGTKNNENNPNDVSRSSLRWHPRSGTMRICRLPHLKNAGRSLILLIFLCLPGCGGETSPSPANKTPSKHQIVVQQSRVINANVNIPVVTLKVCTPDSTTDCENIPNVLVDTGSSGLRLSHTLAISSRLPQESNNGQEVTECLAFVSGFNYGPVVTASVTLANQTVTVPVQISNSSLTAPSSCTSTGPSEPFEPSINGILGVLFPQSDGGSYYLGGSPASISTARMVQNPIFLLSSPNNNGVLLSGFPTVSQTQGAPTASGFMTFGTGNASGLVTLDTTSYGTITANYKGRTLTAFFDSGSNGLFIDNPSLPDCSSTLSGFFCGNASNQSATLTGTRGNSITLNFSIKSAQTLLSTGNMVFSSLGGPFSGVFDAGFPAFLDGQTIGVGWGSDVNTTGKGYFLYGN